MIYLGLSATEKQAVIQAYCEKHPIKKTVVLSPEKYNFPLDPGADAEFIDWPEIIMYRTFYRLLQEIDASTLVVVNECLRTQNRHDLTYNCIRHFLAQAGHILVMQWLPIIDDLQDFMVLFDFATGSRWKRDRFDESLLAECQLQISQRTPSIGAINVPADTKTRAQYQAKKKALFESLGTKDPHTLPRNLYLVSGRSKLPYIEPGRWHIGRNNRLRIKQMQTYKEATYPHAPYRIVELPHNFIDFSDFLALSEQKLIDVLVSELPADQWYYQRYTNWIKRISHAYASLSTGA